MSSKGSSIKLNVYRINKEQTINCIRKNKQLIENSPELSDNLSLELLKDEFEKNIFLSNYQEVFKTVCNKENVSFLLYSYKNNKSNEDIDWFNFWKKIQHTDSVLRRNAETGHGIIVIHLREKEEFYALVFGRAFPLIKNYVETEFGIDMATKLFSGKSIESISSKFFSMTKNKSIISFYTDVEHICEEGEAIDFIKSIIDAKHESEIINEVEELTNLVKKDAEISYSCLKLTLKKEYADDEGLTRVVDLLNQVKDTNKRFDFPSMKKVEPYLSSELDNEFLKMLKNNDIDFDFVVPLYGLNENNNMAFFNTIDEYTIKLNKKSLYKDIVMNKKHIMTVIKDNLDIITDIRKLKLKATVESTNNTGELIKWLDVQITYNETNYVLYDGSWFIFNEEYIKILDAKFQQIVEVVCNYTDKYNRCEEDLQRFKYDNLTELKNSFSTHPVGEESIYREYVYNFRLCKENGWKLFDRIPFDKVEICDINTENALIHVKIGKTRDLEEVIRQSFYGLKLYHNNRSNYKHVKNSKNECLGDITDVKIIFLSDAERNFHLNNTRSLRIKIALIDWYNQVKNMSYKPEIIIGNYV